MRKIFSLFAAILFAGSMMATNYQKVTSASDLVVGAKYVIGTDAGSFIATDNNGNNRKITTTTVNDGVVTATDAMMVFTLGGDAQGWTFATENYLGTAGYLNATSTTGSNYLKVVADLDQYAYFTIVIEEGVTTVTCTGKESRNILYQNGTTCFACYNNQTSSQYHKPNLYKEVAGGGETPAHTYTVAGDNATLFGTTWAPTNEDNDMTLVEGLYKWEKTNQTLPAGNVAFKVCEDHAWTNCWPSDNYVLNIPEAGIYTITITYNPEGNVVNGVAQKTDDAVVIPTVAMHGNFLGSWADTENFAIAEGNETASLTLNLAAGGYEFGMRIGGSGNWTANGAAFTRENNSAVIVAGQGNITLDADAAGEYTFTWTYETNTLTITYPEFVPPTYTYADGYYLIGLDMQEWTMEYMPTEGRLFAANPDNEGEYQLTIALAADQQFKVVSVQKDQIKAWYPDGMDNNYVVDAAHAGEKTVYFRPDGQGGEGWHYGVIYVAANETPTPQPTSSYIFEWVKGEGAKIEADNTDLNANNMGTMTAGTSVVARMLGTNAIDNNAKGYKLGNNDVCVEIEGTSAFAVGDTVIITGVCGGSGARAFAIAPTTTINAVTDTALTNTQENTSEILEYRVIVKEAQAGDKMRIFRMAGKTMYLYSIKVARPAGDTPEPPVVPTAAVTGDMTEWGEPPFELSEDSTFATLYNDNIKKGTYEFKLIINGEWRSNGYEFHRGFPGCAGITGNAEANMTVVIDVEGAYTFKWYFANDSLAIIYPEKPEPVLTNGYYLVGKFDGIDAWDPVAENLFAANPDIEGEYQLAIDLAVDDEVKVVYVENDAIVTWFPAEGDNYVIDDHHNGATTMYFRPDYQGGEDWFAGCIYVIPTSTVGFENTAADAKVVKSLKNGILVIEKNNKVYNVLGIEMK